MLKIPSDRQWKITNNGDLFGVLNYTQNISFDRKGYATITNRPVALYNKGSDTDFSGLILAIVPFDNKIQILTSSAIFALDPTDFTVAQNETSGNPSVGLESDALVWQGRLYVSSQTNLSYWTGSAWTGSLLATTDNKLHPLCVFESQNQLAVGNANTVKLLNTSHSVVQTLTIPSEFDVTSIRYRQNNLFIGTRHLYGGEARMFIWDGGGSSAQQSIGVNASWIYSIENYMSSIVCITNKGQILRYNGGGFDELSSFPSFYSNDILNGGYTTNGKVLNRGMKADGNNLLINIDASTYLYSANVGNGGQLVNQPSGLWCYDPEVGLYHKSLISSDTYTSHTISSIDTGTGIITLATATKAQTGDLVYMNAPGSITGVSADATYSLIRVSDTTIKLALNKYDAQNGYNITLGGSAGTSSVFIASFNNVGDITRSGINGPVEIIPDGYLTDDFINSRIMFGGRPALHTTVATDYLSVCSFCNTLNVGWFVTQKIYSQGLTDTWNKLFVKYGNLNLDSEKIVVKYRTSERFGLPDVYADTATWSDANTFTITPSYKSLYPVEVGDEVTIVSGSGAGQTAHITAISRNSGTGQWTVDLDESLGVATETFYFICQNYKKLGIITNDTTTNDDGYAELGIEANGKFVQFKVELRGHDLYIEDLILTNNTSLYAS